MKKLLALLVSLFAAASVMAGEYPDISVADLKKAIADKKALIVAYCGGPRCNAYTAAANAAKELGYTNVKHLSAGISGWKAAGEKTEAGK